MMKGKMNNPDNCLIGRNVAYSDIARGHSFFPSMQSNGTQEYDFPLDEQYHRESNSHTNL